ncbi:hypothetical protein CGLO_09783 [Colletotrichum gloeosporioides Cg-14]|uniref:Uncharacterized protein n=1 Tax=Colletotrichum gloeosporioides (strain Cg-14) TaxID=1237896 RepID=T0KCS8_COLGC|nr:hypothetical protein CGLO_09783 [Colletotrichum gloeosporioides Cg-14]
MTIDLTVRRFF